MEKDRAENTSGEESGVGSGNGFLTLEEQKAFILWAKEQKIKTLRIRDVEVTFSEIAFLDQVEPIADLTEEELKKLQTNQYYKDLTYSSI